MLSRHGDIRIPHESQYFLHLDPAVYGIACPVGDSDIERYFQCVRSNRTFGDLGYQEGLIDEYFEAVTGGLRSPREQFLWLIDRATDDQSGEIVGEKTPAHWMKIERILTLFPDAKIIHIHRDPRAVTEALLRMPWWHNKSITWTARYCKKTLKACGQWEERLGADRFIHISFERLITEPGRELEKACSFLGIEFDPCMSESDDEKPSSDSFRPRVSSADPSRISMYRERLSGTQIATIEASVGSGILGDFGYMRESGLGDRVRALPVYWGNLIVNRIKKYGNEIMKLNPFGKSTR